MCCAELKEAAEKLRKLKGEKDLNSIQSVSCKSCFFAPPPVFTLLSEDRLCCFRNAFVDI